MSLFSKISKQAREIRGFIENRTRRSFDTHAHFVRNDMAECCFSETWRAMQQHMIQRLTTQLRRFNKNLKILKHLFWPVKSSKDFGRKTLSKFLVTSMSGLFPYIKIIIAHGHWVFLLQKTFCIS
jgi:hypothetical protein